MPQLAVAVAAGMVYKFLFQDDNVPLSNSPPIPLSTCPICGGNVDGRPCPRCSDVPPPTRHDETTADYCGSTVAATRPPATEPMPGGRPSDDLTTRQFSVLESIATRIGTVPHVLLRDTEPGEQPSPLIRPTPNVADSSLRYRIDGEIARGGMGAVLKGHDPDLGRDIAIKVLRDDMRDNADLLRRFVEEAQIGGQLQHPGVVPIHELGAFADGRPFFAMRLVKGKTLADLLSTRTSPADDLPRFLTIFAAVAQTMAYAHTRGVIHRDLKPSNIMVGSFGEVQVMDWGLAKVLPRGGIGDDVRPGDKPESETLIATARSGSDADLSVAGSVLGTPSYMPPEQALGEIDRIDERADVFSLGSILAEILTGKPAITGRSVREILLKAALGDTNEARARLADSGAEAELVAIAADCLEREPGDRPRNATVVADRITGYQDGVQERVQAAVRERAVAKAKAIEGRKRRRLQLGLGASSIAIIVMGGVAFLTQQQRTATREAIATAVLAQVDVFLLKGDLQGANGAAIQAGQIASEIPHVSDRIKAKQGEIRSRIVAYQHGIHSAEVVQPLRSIRFDEGLASLPVMNAWLADNAYNTQYARISGKWTPHWDDPKNMMTLPDGYSWRDGVFYSKNNVPIDDGPRFPGQTGIGEVVGDTKDWLPETRNVIRESLDNWLSLLIQGNGLEGGQPEIAGIGRARDFFRVRVRLLVESARSIDPDPIRNKLRGIVAEENRSVQDAALIRFVDSGTHANLDALSLIIIGRMMARSSDFVRMERVMRQALSLYPNDVWVHYEFAQMLDRHLGRSSEALRHYVVVKALNHDVDVDLEIESLLQKQGEAIDAPSPVIRRDPFPVRWQGPEWYYEDSRRVTLLMGLGRRTDAKAAMEDRCSRLRTILLSKDFRIPPQFQSLVMGSLAKDLFRVESYDKAIQYSKISLNYDRDNPWPHFLLSRIALEQREFKEVFAGFTQGAGLIMKRPRQ